MDEIVYILINEAMPGYVKIGRTTNLEKRVRELDKTNVPLPFECHYACTVKDSKFVEDKLHDAFLNNRIRSSREFFEIEPERVVSALKLCCLKDVTPQKDFVETQEDQKALDKKRKNRDTFNFKIVDIPIGAELYFSRDENIKAKVVDNRNIEFNGKSTSLSLSARELLGYRASGPLYWMYEGETLDERRKRIEQE
ncbi:MAG: GIY-YIG nuclease family protein [Candidatus Campbellbacteria bacterium]|nr:GIY-YIG nuclease family protein [Candidatus Campbellbacteria bacterium]